MKPTLDGKDLESRLQRLTQQEGIYRSDLPALLGNELCAAWGIQPDVEPLDATRNKAARYLASAILMLPSQELREIAKVCFNVTTSTELAAMKLGSRQEWLAKQPNGPRLGEKSIRDRLRAVVIPELAKVLRDSAIQPSPAPNVQKPSAAPSPSRRRRWFLAAGAVGMATVVVMAGLNWWPQDSDGKPDSASTLPFAINVEPDPQIAKFGVPISAPSWLFPAGKAKTLAPNLNQSCQDWYRWAHDNGGIDVGRTYVSINITALSHKTVQVVGAMLRAKDLGLKSGDLVICPQGDPTEISHLSIDLDRRRADFVHPEKTDRGTMFTPGPMAINVIEAKPERIDIVAAATKCNCSWSLELRFLVDGKSYSSIVDDHGKDFLTLGTSGETLWPTYEQGFGGLSCISSCT